MHPDDVIDRLKLDEAELARRRKHFGVGDDDLARLGQLRAVAAAHNDEVVEALYRFLLDDPESRSFFPDAATVARVKQLQRQYFLGLFSGRCDLAYVRDRVRVGATHEAIRLPVRLYLGMYSTYLQLIRDVFRRELDVERSDAAYGSFKKLVFFDMSLAIDTYVAAAQDTLVRHQVAIRELSTPVIRIYDRVLLLPLVGTIDTARAQQVMETLLLRVAEEQARVAIIDISGVPVVDTKVAENLIMTTNAVRLLGAETVITGITPVVAKTIVQLGIHLPTLQTRGRLEDGIVFALHALGKAITERRA